jgi:hypothetical protein
MFDSIRGTRTFKNGVHTLVLEIPKKVYMDFYQNIGNSDGADLLSQYLNHHQDDAIPKNIKIKYSKDDHMMRIYADLHYLGNKKSKSDYYDDVPD